jgi:hypothetical protein
VKWGFFLLGCFVPLGAPPGALRLPNLVREVKRLRRRSPKWHQPSLRDVAAELERLGISISEASSPQLRLCG